MTEYKIVVDTSLGAGNCVAQQVPLTDAEIAQQATDAATAAALASAPQMPTLEQQVAALWAQVVNGDSTQTATLTPQINTFNAAVAAKNGTATGGSTATSTTGSTTTNTVAPTVTTNS